MSPHEFISKWRASTLNERASSQEHFIDLCHLLDEPTPVQADPTGTFYRFEKAVSKTLGGDGAADVWKRGAFGWEYKGKKRDLHQAYAQLLNYSVALENPPLLIVSDMDTIRVHTNFTNTVQQIHNIRLDDLLAPQTHALLKSAFSHPETLRPGITRESLTLEAATKFGSLATTLRERGHDAHTVAHFINKILFCLFAEDIGLLPERLFTRLLESARNRPESLTLFSMTWREPSLRCA